MASTLYNQDFKPEISTNYEAGFDFRMFDNRIGVDFSFYYNRTKNQILDAPLDPTTKDTAAAINSGCVRNRGYELEITATPVLTRDFRWNTTLTWSKNDNKILSLAEGADENQVISTVGTASIIGRVGGTTGGYGATNWVRDPEGNVIIGDNGFRTSRRNRICKVQPMPTGKPDGIMSSLIKGFKIRNCLTDK